jgi:hypothetical protein
MWHHSVLPHVQTTQDAVGRANRAHVTNKIYNQNFSRKIEGKRPLGKPRLRWDELN